MIKWFVILICMGYVMANTDIVQWQGQYYIGTTFQVGTYPFAFNVYDDPVAGTLCYSNTTNLSLGTFGLWNTTQWGVATNCSDATRDYWVDIQISGLSQPPRRLLSVLLYMRKNVNETTNASITAVSFHGNLNSSYVQNPYWLNETDQRYNETLHIENLTTNKSATGDCTVNQFMYGTNYSSVRCSRPTFGNISGTVNDSQMTNQKRNYTDNSFGSLSCGSLECGDIEGNLAHSNIYLAEPYEISFPNAGTYYDISLENISFSNRFIQDSGGLKTDKPGYVNAHLVFSIQNSHTSVDTYFAAVCIDSVPQPQSVSRFSLASGFLHDGDFQISSVSIIMDNGGIITACIAAENGGEDLLINNIQLVLTEVGYP